MEGRRHRSSIAKGEGARGGQGHLVNDFDNALVKNLAEEAKRGVKKRRGSNSEGPSQSGDKGQQHAAATTRKKEGGRRRSSFFMVDGPMVDGRWSVDGARDRSWGQEQNLLVQRMKKRGGGGSTARGIHPGVKNKINVGRNSILDDASQISNF